MMCSESTSSVAKKLIKFQYATIEASSGSSDEQTSDNRLLCSDKPTFNSTCVITISSLTIKSATDLELQNIESEILAKRCFGLELGSSVELRLGFGESELSDVLDACVESMRVGDRTVFDVTLSKDLDKIKRGFSFSLTVELSGVTGIKEMFEHSSSEIIELVNSLKEKGTKVFKDSYVHTAATFYARALKLLVASAAIEMNEKEKEKILELKNVLHLNLSLCQLSRGFYSQVVKNCTKVLEKDSESLKALYRRSKANLYLKDLAVARKDCELLLELQPNHKNFKDLQKQILKKLTEENRVMNSRLRSMFSA